MEENNGQEPSSNNDNKNNANNDRKNNEEPQRSLFPILLIVSTIILLLVFFMKSNNAKPITWGKAIEHIKSGDVVRVKVKAEHLMLEYKEGADFKQTIAFYPASVCGDADKNLITDAVKFATSNGHVVYEEGTSRPSQWGDVLVNILFFGFIIFIMWFLFFRKLGAGGAMSFGKSKAKLITKENSEKSFEDVAGVDEAKEEVEEIVEFLKTPDKFQKLGARIPKGVMLVGPPGTGKTLLAKAIAGEADVPFFLINGSDFVEMFVGVGASRVRDLFLQAKENSPCIIFIDEIDAVARKRSSGGGHGGHDEREQTLNAILVEMDGFSSDAKVIVMAATNRVDVLDPALLRPGRFDRHIHVDLPDIKGREQILQVHAKKIVLEENLNLSTIARGTPGFSGADLENLINEGALHAARNDKESVGIHDLEYARDRIAFGREKKGRGDSISQEDKKDTAYHEAGHAIIQLLLPECDDLHKISIIPRGRALGMTMGLPKNDKYSKTKTDLLGDMSCLLGGRIAEEKFLNDISTGASNDIERATAIAKAMVYELGMSKKMGIVKYTENQAGYFDAQPVVYVSEQTRRELDEEVRKVLDEQYARTEELIENNREPIEKIVELLIEKEVVTVEEIEDMLGWNQKDDEEEQEEQEQEQEEQEEQVVLEDSVAIDNSEEDKSDNKPLEIIENETEG